MHLLRYALLTEIASDFASFISFNLTWIDFIGNGTLIEFVKATLQTQQVEYQMSCTSLQSPHVINIHACMHACKWNSSIKFIGIEESFGSLNCLRWASLHVNCRY